MNSAHLFARHRACLHASWLHTKGLYRMDFQFLASQKRMLIMLVILIAVYSFAGLQSFLIPLIPVLVSLLASKTIVPSLYERSSRFIMTLPFTRKEFVREKYKFSIGCSALALLIMALITFLFDPSALDAVLMTSYLVILFLLLLPAITFPVIIRFGTASLMYIGILLALVMAGGILLFTADLISVAALLTLFEVWGTWIALGAAAVVLIVLRISLMISDRLIEKIEF